MNDLLVLFNIYASEYFGSYGCISFDYIYDVLCEYL